MNPFSAKVAFSSLFGSLNLLSSKWAWSLALTSSLTKNLIRSGLKFNHSLKELILGAIGGWCPLHLIVAQLLYPRSFRFRRISRLYQTSFFSSSSSAFFSSFSRTLGTFSSHDRASPGNNLLCIDIKPCYLIELPSSSRLKCHGWQHFLAWEESKGSLQTGPILLGVILF